jgi:hypothetical protein
MTEALSKEALRGGAARPLVGDLYPRGYVVGYAGQAAGIAGEFRYGDRHHVNRKQNSMSSTVGAESGGTGKGIFVALVPWIIFTVLAAHSTLKIGALIALAAAVVIAHWVSRYARGIAALILAAIAFGSLLFVPFTEQYAREQVPEQYWDSPHFKQINRKLTALWGFVFIAMVPFHIIAGAVNTKPATISATGSSRWGW